MDPLSFYKQQISLKQELIRRLSFRRNLITAGKLIAFVAIVYMVYLVFTAYSIVNLLTGIGFLAIFLVLSVLDSGILHKLELYKTCISVSQGETDYLNGDISGLKEGNEYASLSHSYAHDLDMFGSNSLFQAVNRTISIQGEKLLKDWLLTPCKEEKEIYERQEAVKELSGKMRWCEHFRAAGLLHKTNVDDLKVIRQWIGGEYFFKKSYIRYVIYGVNLVVIAGWIIAIAGVIPYSLAALISLLQLAFMLVRIKHINRLHQELDLFIRSVGNYFYLVERIMKEEFESTSMKAIQHKLLCPQPALFAFSELNNILNSMEQRNNAVAMILLNALYLKDFHTIIKLDTWRTVYADRIEQWMNAVSRADALVSMAYYRFNHPAYIYPVVDESVLIDARDMGHPLLRTDKMVCNDFNIKDLHNLFIITGANMAGKSTFLRSVGTNLVLALSGNVVCSGNFSFSVMDIFTSMRTTDNLAEGTSYFHAELLRLKQLTIQAEKADKMFIILDEMLKGTNSQDKLHGSEAFLKKLLAYPVSGLIATHDLALGKLAANDPEHFYTVCFEITHSGEDIVYDYKLRPGVSRNMNASILLKQMGLIDN